MKTNSIHPNRGIRSPGKGPWLFCWALAAALLYPVSARAGNVENLAKQLPGEVRLFRVADCPAFCIMPLKEKALPGPGPWIWYAPTFLAAHPDASHTWMFRQFLDRGIAIAGIEVGESYGSPKGRGAYTALYETLVKQHGLSPKACLLAQSRGGLMLYNWAVEHPESVACAVGIYPVCDLRSYPGLERACGAYGLTRDQLAAALAEQNPIERLAPLAKAGVPVLHVHGDSDRVVPLDDNSAEFARRYRALGGEMTLLVVPGKGHQVCPEFFRCQPLVDFLIGQARPATRR